MAGERAKVSQIDSVVAQRNRLEKIRQPIRRLRADRSHHASVLEAFESAHAVAGRAADEAVAAALLTLLHAEEERAIEAFEAAGYEVDVE